MFGKLLRSLLVLNLSGACAFAADGNFATQSDQITESLTKPRSKFSFQISGTPQGMKKARTIEVYEESNGQLIKNTVLLLEDAPAPSVNLKIEFDVNSHTIRASSQPVLNELGKALTDDALKSMAIAIKGHTDSDGDEAKNLELSCRRAMAVKSYLVKNFTIPESRMKAIGYGQACPLVPNDSDKNKQVNRRVEIEALGAQ